MATPALKVVEATGPIDVPSEQRAMLDVIEGLERDIRGWTRRYAELQRDKDAEARAHESWPTLMALFAYWREETGHLKARWTGDRFWAALPLWQSFGTGNCAAGVAGIGHEPNRKQLKNGRWEVYNSWELLFRNAGTLERYAKRRPKDWVLPARFEAMV